MTKQARQITDASFVDDLKQDGQPAMIVFVAEWCGAYHILEPLINRLSKHYAESIHSWTLDIEHYPQTKASFNIHKLPTLLLFNNGELVEQFSGLISEHELREKLNRMVATDQSQR